MDRVDCVVIGAGVVGIAIARRLSLAGHEVVLLEGEHSFGQGVSARNSEVIHAGFYYPTGSAKARLCVAGNEALYRYCDERGVDARALGKLVVATGAGQTQVLSDLFERGRANGVPGLRLLGRDEVLDLEPELRCEAALLSPRTGVVDSHGFMRAMLADVLAAGGAAIFDSPVSSGACGPDGVTLRLADRDGTQLVARTVVNATGLAATEVAAAISGPHQADVPTPRFAKGTYFTLSGASPFSRLVYPVPEPGGLGIHLTLDLDGRARFGPDVEWLDHDRRDLDYAVDPARAPSFYTAVRRYWPGLPDGGLAPGFSGVRPKVVGRSGTIDDFRIDLGAGLVNLYGIESPGLTSALAIADVVGADVDARAREARG